MRKRSPEPQRSGPEQTDNTAGFLMGHGTEAAAATAGKGTREYAEPLTSESRSVPLKSLSPTLSMRAKVPVAGGEAGEPRDTSNPP